ncbi:hypothetical protein DID78_00940 [Candidatus Marinamargulisbacteria bacterium SCGC AG-343-D04]|nr:hypothetical protein DID78_00940 [Candidatus Marinamargulisbacteria bacterium SCGC AG-343-D04]
MPVVSVLIVNFNGARFISNCLDSLLKSQGDFDLDVVVVDNCSTDQSLDVLSTYKSKITLVKNRHNSGFSKGTNIAASYAKGEYYFLLNNDTVVEQNTIQLLLEYLKEHDDIGALVPKLLNEDGSIQCPGSFLGHWRFKSTKAIDVPFVAGAAVLMTNIVYNSIGGLDENLFFYNEDVDLCKTLLKRKLRLVYFPSSQLIHYGGLSTKFRKIGSLIEGYRGGFYVCYKHYPYLFFIYRVLVMLDVLLRLCIHMLRAFFSVHQREYVSLYLTIIRIIVRKDIFINHPELEVEVIS